MGPAVNLWFSLPALRIFCQLVHHQKKTEGPNSYHSPTKQLLAELRDEQHGSCNLRITSPQDPYRLETELVSLICCAQGHFLLTVTRTRDYIMRKFSATTHRLNRTKDCAFVTPSPVGVAMVIDVHPSPPAPRPAI